MRVLTSFLFLLLLPTAVWSQTDPNKSKPNLSGKWVLDDLKSNIQPLAPEKPLLIAHSDPEIRFSYEQPTAQPPAEPRIYYTDGRGESNRSTSFVTTRPASNSKPVDEFTKSKTRWRGNKLETRSTLRNLIAGHMLEFELVDQWQLSSDGKILTHISRIIYRQDASPAAFIPAAVPDRKKVYNRVN